MDENQLPIGRVLNGDCIEVMKQFPSDCIGAIITDSPY